MSPTLERHALSTPFAEATEADMHALEESIRQRGFDPRHPIVLYEGKILDGWHRYLACRQLNIEPQFEDFIGDNAAALEFVFSENMARRQMS